nr:uncharacterized protein LOC109154451 [Ipomoea batatas]
MFGELKHDMANMKNEIRQEWKQDLRQEMSTIRQDVSNLRQEHHASLRNLETQVAQNSKALTERPQGTLPSTTVNNPRERVQAVTLRSGKELPEPTLKKNTISKSPVEEDKVEEILENDKEQEKETSPSPLSPKATQSRDKERKRAKTSEVSKTEEEQEKVKIGENPTLDAIPDSRPFRVQWPRSSERSDGRASDTRPSEREAGPEPGLPRAEMMVPRHTLERGEPSGVLNEDTSSNEEETPNVEFANRGLMIEGEELFRYRHFRDNWRDATYVPIVREFISTLEVNERVHNRRQPSIKFKLFHRQYDISSDELGNLLGFYTLHDQEQRWYANLVDDFLNEHQPELFWWGIARQGIAWRPSYTSVKYIKVLELKIMWHIIAWSWLGRQTLNDNVTRRELFMLWSMYTETPIHMGELCKTLLKRQSYEDSESIFVEPIVSRLCEALGFGDALAYEVVATTITPLDIGDFIQFGIPPEEFSDDEARGEQ